MFISLGLEYISFIYLLIYLGAVVVLYLIAIYTVGTHFFDNLEPRNLSYVRTINWIIVFLFYFCFILIVFKIKGFLFYFGYNSLYTTFDLSQLIYFSKYNQLDTIAFILYDYYPIATILGGLILFVALIGAVVLTKSFNENLSINKSFTNNTLKKKK